MQHLGAPPGITALIEGYSMARNTIGESGCGVYRVFREPEAPELYLKHGAGTAGQDLIDEFTRMRWMQGKLPVPRILHFESDANAAWLLMSAISGQTAYQLLEANDDCADSTIDALAAFLRQIHAIPVDSCPFNSHRRMRMLHARQRLEAGLVDADDFDDARQGWTPEQVWQALNDLADFADDLVVTHGDYSLDNLFISAGRVTGCIDLGRSGTADRYQDLAVIWNCLDEFGSAAQDRFLKAYGIETIDRHRLEFHLLLDEMF